MHKSDREKFRLRSNPVFTVPGMGNYDNKNWLIMYSGEWKE